MKKSTNLLPPQKNNTDKGDKSEKSQKSSEAVVASKNKKINTVEKSDKPGSIPVTNIYNKSNQIENPQK